MDWEAHFTIALSILKRLNKNDDCFAALYRECGFSFEEETGSTLGQKSGQEDQ